MNMLVWVNKYINIRTVSRACRLIGTEIKNGSRSKAGQSNCWKWCNMLAWFLQTSSRK